jgi:hypothetical protein
MQRFFVNQVKLITVNICLLELSPFSFYYLDFSKKKSQAIIVTTASASGWVKFSDKFFVRVHFSKTIKGIHLKLGILVHYQKRNQLQQGR